MYKYDLITILGPTASGKTAFATSLAAQLESEIISADSRQLYRGMDLGTGKDLSDYIVKEGGFLTESTAETLGEVEVVKLSSANNAKEEILDAIYNVEGSCDLSTYNVSVLHSQNYHHTMIQMLNIHIIHNYKSNSPLNCIMLFCLYSYFPLLILLRLTIHLKCNHIILHNILPSCS